MDIPKFDDLVEKKMLTGDKVRIDDLLNKPIVVCGFQVSTSKYKDKGCGYCTKVQFYYADDETKTKRVFFSGSGVIKDNIESAEKALKERGLPFIFGTVIKKSGNCYTLE